MDFMDQTNGTRLIPTNTYIQLEKAQSILQPYAAAMELIIMLPAYSLFMRPTLSYIKGFPKSRKAAIVGYPPHTIPIHVLICLSIIGRYYTRLLLTKNNKPIPTPIDFGLGATQLATGFYLAKWTPSKRKLYKSSFLTMPMLMTVALAWAYATQSPQWHRTYVKCVEWFVHFRLVALAIQKWHAFDSPRVPQDAVLHLVSVPITLALADWNGAIPVYFAILAAVIPLMEWVTRQVPNNEAKRTPLVGLLVAAGFCEHQTLRPPVPVDAAADADADAAKTGKKE